MSVGKSGQSRRIYIHDPCWTPCSIGETHFERFQTCFSGHTGILSSFSNFFLECLYVFVCVYYACVCDLTDPFFILSWYSRVICERPTKRTNGDWLVFMRRFKLRTNSASCNLLLPSTVTLRDNIQDSKVSDLHLIIYYSQLTYNYKTSI